MPTVTTPPPVESVNGEEGNVTVDTLGAGAVVAFDYLDVIQS